MVMATLDHWRAVEKTAMLHWLPDPYWKGSVQVIILQGTNIDHWGKKEVLVDKAEACYATC